MNYKTRAGRQTCEGFKTVCHKYNENKNLNTENLATHCAAGMQLVLCC
jgi:hypothetical protein